MKPLKDKQGKSIVKALSLLIMLERPKLIQADQGTEFFNKNVAKMLQAFGAKLYHSFSDNKAAIVERVQRTIRMRFGRLFTSNTNHNWIDHFEDIASAYNNSKHSSHLMKPSDITTEHTGLIFHRLFISGKKLSNRKLFKIGDRVRIALKPEFMRKEYIPKWSKEVFTIKRTIGTNPVTYFLTDKAREELKGSFYVEELQNAV